MASRMLQQMHAHTPGWTWDKNNTDAAIEDINDSVSSVNVARITSWKKRSVMNLLVHLPAQCTNLIYQEYHEWGWEHSFMSEDLMRQGFWVPGHKLKASEEWSLMYTVTESVLVHFLKVLSRWWKSIAPGHGTSVQHVQSLKPMKQTTAECEGMSIAQFLLHCSCVFCNWLLPECEKSFGNYCRAVLEDLVVSKCASTLCFYFQS